MTLTKTQHNALWAAFTKGGAWYGRQGGLAGGSYRRMCNRLAEQKLVSASAPFPIEQEGLLALHASCHARWAKSGCMAYQQDLEQVEAVLNFKPGTRP